MASLAVGVIETVNGSYMYLRQGQLQVMMSTEALTLYINNDEEFVDVVWREITAHAETHSPCVLRFPNYTDSCKKIGFYLTANPNYTFEIECDRVKTIRQGAFRECRNLLKVTMCCVILVNEGAFWRCTALKTVTMDAVLNIKSSAFALCTSLKTAHVPVVTTLGEKTFRRCNTLEYVDMPELTDVQFEAFYACESLKAVSLPAVKVIPSRAFMSCKALEHVDIPNVTRVERSAFSSCDSLVIVSLPRVTEICVNAFDGCKSLTTVSSPDVTVIGEGSFSFCRSLTTVLLPNVTRIATNPYGVDATHPYGIESAFNHCVAIAHVVCPFAALENLLSPYNSGPVIVRFSGVLTAQERQDLPRAVRGWTGTKLFRNADKQSAIALLAANQRNFFNLPSKLAKLPLPATELIIKLIVPVYAIYKQNT